MLASASEAQPSEGDVRPYTTYKAFGGILVVWSLPAVILILLRDTPPGGGSPLPLSVASVPAIIAALGFFIFMVSDRKIKAERQAIAGENRRAGGRRVDWKGMLIAAGFLVLFLVFIVVR